MQVMHHLPLYTHLWAFNNSNVHLNPRCGNEAGPRKHSWSKPLQLSDWRNTRHDQETELPELEHTFAKERNVILGRVEFFFLTFFFYPEAARSAIIQSFWAWAFTGKGGSKKLKVGQGGLVSERPQFGSLGESWWRQKFVWQSNSNTFFVLFVFWRF